MRILHVVPSYLPAVRYGGPIFSIHNLCSALVKRGHEVHVFTTNVDGDADSDVLLGVPVLLAGVSVWYFPVPMLRRLYWAPRMRAALKHRISGFDILHTHSVFLWPTWAAARLAREHGIPYLLAPRGMLVKELIRRKSPVLKRGWISLVEKSNLEKAAGVHVTSGAEAMELAKFGFSLPPIYEVPNGFDPGSDASAIGCALPQAIEAALSGGRPTLLCLGRIDWKKGLDRLIRALVLVPEAILLAVGNDEEDYTAKLIELARQEQVGDRVFFPGPVYGPAKSEIFRRAALLALPSYSENFGNVVLEAMAEGCPVIVSPEVGASPIVAESGGGMVVSGEPHLLAEAIRRLIASPEMRREMGQRGRNWILGRYSWDSVAGRMVDAYRQVIKEGAARGIRSGRAN